MSNSIKQLLELKKAAQKVINDCRNGTIKKKIAERTAEKVYSDIKKLFDQGVKDYYDAYSPHYYRRTHSLYKAYNITLKGSYISWDVGSHLIPKTHRVDSVDDTYIFNYMFEQGFHGGANTEDGMLWRTPPPVVSGQKAYTDWGRNAVQTEAPSDIIEGYIDDYEASGLIELAYEQAKNEVLAGYDLFKY